MSDFQPPKTLQQHRPLLLALEAIGWLHMTGKAKAQFLQSHGGQGNYDYTKWHEQENLPFSWNDLLKWAKNKFHLQNNFWPGTLTDFLAKHAGRNAGLLGLLQAGHGMASGIEKQSYPQNTVKYLGQDTTHMWLSTAFGRPVRNLLADPPELLSESGWKDIVEQIEKLLKDLEKLGNPASPPTINDLDGWWQWRDGAVGYDGWLRRAFSATLAETRLPNNDVTLFDQSYVAAALFKSAAAAAILEGGLFPWMIKNKKGNDQPNESLKQQTRWRLLTIGIGADHFEARAVKIGDWTGARLALDEFSRKVRRLVEVDLAVGSLLYADGTVCVFSFPGELYNHNGDDLQIEKWQSSLAEQIDGYAGEAELEIPPYCSISEPSRSLVGMTAEIRKAKDTMTVPLHRDWIIPDQNPKDNGGHVCPVCLVRRSGSNSSKQTACNSCKGRRTGRCRAWLEGKQGTDTIWISEVADRNDRVALITMSLDIEPWLDGSRLDALRAQSVAEWAAQNTTEEKPLPKDHGELIDLVRTALEKKTQNEGRKARSLIQKKIVPGLKDEERQDIPWDKFYELMVEDRADAPEWGQLNNDERAKWIAHQLFRKLPSPGRIYRFQRQAEEFFDNLLKKFRELAASNENRWRVRRLILKPDNGPSGSWENNQPYNGQLNGIPLDLLYRKNLEGFITISNMSRILGKTRNKDYLKNKTIKLKNDDNQPIDPLTVGRVEEIDSTLDVYSPLIRLELSPVRFRVLVPLEAASKCVDHAIAAWRDQFARVWDRLPLRVGVVGFTRKTPFQAVIEAARNMEADLTANSEGHEIWRVAECETRDGVTALSLRSLDGQSQILKTMPIRFPDGREDVFYPYLAVEDKQTRFPCDFRHPEGQVYRHAKDLRSGDGVRIHPSRIATLFLDSTARRFERQEPSYLERWKQMRELWELIDRSVPSQTALRSTWSELVGRREAWQGPDLPAASAAQAGETWLEGGKAAWLDLVRVVFYDRLGLHGDCLETLVQAAGDGILEWSLQWHLSVLKKQVSGRPARSRTQTGGE